MLPIILDSIWKWAILGNDAAQLAFLLALLLALASGTHKTDVNLKWPTYKIANMAQISQIKCGPFFGKDVVLSGMCILDAGQFWFIWFVLG